MEQAEEQKRRFGNTRCSIGVRPYSHFYSTQTTCITLSDDTR